MRLIFAFLMLFSVPVMAQTTQYEADVKRLYDVIYWPILHSAVACPKSRYPDATQRANCEQNVAGRGLRFVTDARGKAEARECARFHAGLLACLDRLGRQQRGIRIQSGEFLA